MDIHTRKIAFIQQFLKLKNEKTIDQLEKLLQKEDSRNNSESINSMTIEEFNKRIDKSMEDSKSDRSISVEELKSQLSKWE